MRAQAVLDAGWTVRALAGPGAQRVVDPVPAVVPGCVHTDLLRAGLIPDPALDDNEVTTGWVGRTDWRFTTRPTAALLSPLEEHERLDLVLDGVDTVATVRLDGAEVLHTANLHRSWRVDARALRGHGGHEVAVDIRSAWDVGAAEQARLGGPLPAASAAPYNVLRTSACSFGWDWGPDAVTAGLWRPVRLEAWSTARLAAVRPQVTVDGTAGLVRVRADLDRTAAVPLRLAASVRRPDGEAVTAEAPVDVAADVAEVTLPVPDVQRWWPHSLGEPVLHGLEVGLLDDSGAVLDRWARRIGFREVLLDTTPDAAGSAFTLVVNGSPVFVRGVNWVPDDAFPARVDRARYATRLAQARDAHADLVRVWGGGLYEAEDFYDVCDQLGLLVWQDFAFACAAYPQEERFAAEVEAEAREAVTRLMPHPSLALWNGNNENLWGYVDWGWREQLDGRPWGEGYYLDLLPRIVAETDPTRPYNAGSPWSGSWDHHPNDPDHGCTHIWDVWNERDLTAYRDRVPRFVAEFGWQAPPAWATLRRAVSDTPLTPDSPGVAHHQKAQDGNLKLARGIATHLGEPASTADWHYFAQVVQARAVSVGVEHFRSHRGRCMGTVWWQLNDCWPVTSWSLVDGDGRRKPAWYALRRAYRPRLLTVQPRDGRLAVVAVNDTTTPWHDLLRARRLGVDGAALPGADVTVALVVPPLSRQEVALPVALTRAHDPSREVLQVTTVADEAWWWYAPERELAFGAPRFDARVVPVAGGLDVTVTAATFLREVCLFADRVDPGAAVDDMLVTLAPGHRRTFEVRLPGLAPDGLGGDGWTTAPVLRCLGDSTAPPTPLPSRERTPGP